VRCSAALLLAGVAAGPGHALEGDDRAPCALRDPLRRPWFGDLHVHTRHSLDASTQGTRTTPRDAYRFAQGEEIALHPFDAQGRPQRRARLDRPLDFAAVTDHSELFGEVHLCSTPNSAGHDSMVCRIYRGWPRLAFFLMNGRGSPRFGFCGEDGRDCIEAGRGPWLEMQEAADEAYDRSPACRFTSFVGYEWTKSVETASNLHRNVIFRTSFVPDVPASSIDFPTPADLWDALDADCRASEPGCDAVVIPHNSNLSGGFMFAAESEGVGAPVDAERARRRAANEPLVEVMQHKGASECHRGAGSEDELCDFELLPYDTFMGRFFPFARRPADAINFTRTALGAGLAHEARLGANPFAFGLIGSTDTHLGTPGLASEAWTGGHGGAGIPLGEVIPDSLLDPIEYNPGGLAVLYAEENSRQSLFDAMRRREAYATSGPRIGLRLFAGFGLKEELCGDPDFVARGYAGGVPMGGELRGPAPDSPNAPLRVAAWALRDPGGGGEPSIPLQRLQVVKLWLTREGLVREQVVDVAGSEQSDAGVDPRTCEPHGQGFDQLCRVWTDPDFDAGERALYYARVVENPTCRWSARACNAAGIACDDPGSVRRGFEACCDESVPRTVQERAWSSPIWYTPPR
jgi:hypothetical protein